MSYLARSRAQRRTEIQPYVEVFRWKPESVVVRYFPHGRVTGWQSVDSHNRVTVLFTYDERHFSPEPVKLVWDPVRAVFFHHTIVIGFLEGHDRNNVRLLEVCRPMARWIEFLKLSRQENSFFQHDIFDGHVLSLVKKFD